MGGMNWMHVWCYEYFWYKYICFMHFYRNYLIEFIEILLLQNTKILKEINVILSKNKFSNNIHFFKSENYVLNLLNNLFAFSYEIENIFTI